MEAPKVARSTHERAHTRPGKRTSETDENRRLETAQERNCGLGKMVVRWQAASEHVFVSIDFSGDRVDVKSEKFERVAFWEKSSVGRMWWKETRSFVERKQTSDGRNRWMFCRSQDRSAHTFVANAEIHTWST